ncbi:porin family protein [Capnocytophaga genosp. AHN8471]|uniref:outer membrane beta-barrel protein n=1 Tax=Capnocytophaga genosp. AHN8471 TaxID=327574 RepID=UPI001931888E|nr:outer membrane beta-barrel protein [Capnocytophaga genosp. AHN8471]MBM0652807.1 porin family protein [Capnocytophaga genosp. AHN8471]
MKKFLLMVAVAFSAATYAQTEKGNWMAGSDLGLSYQSSKETTSRKSGNTTVENEKTTNTFKFIPNINYFVINNLAVGLGLEYRHEKTKGASDATNTFAIAPNAHYYFPIGGKLAPFVGAKVGHAWQSEGSSDSQKSRGFLFGLKGGIAYFVNEGAALTGYLSYDHQKLKNKENSNYSITNGTFGVGIGVALFF